ncbi:MAG: Do family serine endopeptidase [Pseudomonadota bacterium]|nr:Do family serine endopeptidase [Pseudomonadota bacterium]
MSSCRALIPALALLAACSGPAPASRAQSAEAQSNEPLPAPRRVPPNLAALQMSFAPIVRRAAPAVVNVYSRRVVRSQVDPFWGLFAGGGPARDRVEQSLGSGSIVRADGVILTNHHNIENAQEIMVVTADRREWPARVLLDDARADLAVLKIDTKAERLPTIAIDAAASPQVGDLVLAIGDPFGVGQTVTNGIVSALARSDVGISDYSFFIQTDAAINPGNSGGPLVDMDGDLIGVNTAIVSGSGTSSGVGFAIPAVMAKQVVNAALGGGHAVVRPWLGVKTQGLTGDMAKSLGLAAPQGVVVTDVWPGGPAARAGLVQGDVIVSVNGQAINDDAGLTYTVATRGAGDALALAVRRNGGSPRILTAKAEASPARPAPDARTLAGRNPLAGASVVNVSSAAAYQYGVDPFSAQGVLVTAVGQGFAQQIGLRPGDFIRQINGAKIADTADLAAALRLGSGAWSLVIQRGGQTITARFQG